MVKLEVDVPNDVGASLCSGHASAKNRDVWEMTLDVFEYI